jgi:hypothetical protein
VSGVKAWLSTLAALLIVAGLVVSLSAIPLASKGVQDVATNAESEDEVDIANNTVAVRPAFNLTFENALELAYDVRNVTYPLFQWEISHNVTAANVTLNLGDNFLDKALNLSSSNETRRATVMAIVAAIHYSHAVPLAYPVVGKTIDSLFNANATSGDITSAVINLAQELKSILLNAVSIAEARNLTIPSSLDNITAIGDKLIANAQSNLSAGNITLAFRLAMSGYHTYVKAYGLLVTSIFIQDLQLPARHDIGVFFFHEKIGRETLVKVFEKLPEGLKETVIAKIEKGEVNETGEVVGYVREVALMWNTKARELANDYIRSLLENLTLKTVNGSDIARVAIFMKFRSEGEFREAIGQIILNGLSQNKTVSQILNELSNYLGNITNGKFDFRMSLKDKIQNVSIEVGSQVEVEHELENEA